MSQAALGYKNNQRRSDVEGDDGGRASPAKARMHRNTLQSTDQVLT
jgi:hypothetical protein